MHRKSLEAAEHIRKQDENELFNENLSPSTELSSSSPISTSVSPPSVVIKIPTTMITDENDNKNEFKSESVANLRAKAKEHSAKLMEDVNIINTNKNSSYSMNNNKYQINNERKIKTTENNSTCLSDAEDINSYSLEDEEEEGDEGSI